MVDVRNECPLPVLSESVFDHFKITRLADPRLGLISDKDRATMTLENPNMGRLLDQMEKTGKGEEGAGFLFAYGLLRAQALADKGEY